MVKKAYLIAFAVSFIILQAVTQASASVQVHDDQLWVDGQAQPQLFGAEVQYFRLRGGDGPNIPREQVIALWNQALDRVVEAGMNSVSFYIPWDFHEYADGKFDFDGTVDQDGDGKPDYPSRDVLTFIRLIKEHGIKNILVRPGPYINAEWGFLGFGAIPLWFHEKYPDSHARNPQGQKTSLYSYNDPTFLKYSQHWLETVYEHVLKNEMGAGKPIHFIQVDNETNFQWQSLYNHDYGARAVAQYQAFLQARYSTLAALNLAHQSSWQNWSDVLPPAAPGVNLAEDQDWYGFQDRSLFDYLKLIRSFWTNLGVREPQVIFTLAESFNATDNGLLPNYQFRNSPDVGMMTVNLYPKTYETDQHPLLNLPFKADHDVKAAAAANQLYLGARNSWSMGPEIQTGWWQGTDVSPAARQQTYLTTLGHGLKALFVYYFNQGNNWQPHWLKDAITPMYQALKANPQYTAIADSDLPAAFWAALDTQVANQLFVVDTHTVWTNGGSQPQELYFDAPLDGSAQPRAPFQQLKDIGQKIVQAHGDFLGSAHELEDPVCLVQDPASNVPIDPKTNFDQATSIHIQSDMSGGLIAWLMHAGVNPRIHQWGISPASDLLDPKLCRLVIYQDTGFASEALQNTLNQVVVNGGALLSFINSNVAETIRTQNSVVGCPLIPSLPMDVQGYECQIGQGTLFYAQVPIYDVFNTDFYFLIADAPARRGVLDRILSEIKLTPKLQIQGGGDRTVAFARTSPDERSLWITLKTSRLDGSQGVLQWQNAQPWQSYTVTDVLAGTSQEMTGQALLAQGLPFSLDASGSKVIFVEAEREMRLWVLVLLVVPGLSYASAALDAWIQSERAVSIQKILQNISPVDAVKGTVVASPSKNNPNYYFHWVRDSSLTMDQIVSIWSQSQGTDRSFYQGLIEDYITLSAEQQLEPATEGLGEPRYNVDGSVDTIPWSRPQYDGPALRTLTLLHYLKILGQPHLQSSQAAHDVIERDQAYLLTHWNIVCFDLWEELKGFHFYTQTVQQAAFQAAALYFAELGEVQFAASLNQASQDETQMLAQYWDTARSYIGASHDLQLPAGSQYKSSNLDTAVVLGTLHSGSPINDPHFLATLQALEGVFTQIYPMDQNSAQFAMGRFSDDTYYGGNPWYMTTAAYAETYYRLAVELAYAGSPDSQAQIDHGDQFLLTLKNFVGPSGEMSEQFDRRTGAPLSAPDLTWSYAAFLSATTARAQALINRSLK